MQSDIAHILTLFHLPEGERSYEPFGSGYINSTYRVTILSPQGRRRFILQRVNQGVFHHPRQVIANIERVTEHLRRVIAAEGGDPARGTLTLIPSKDGRHYILDDQGELWRMYVFIEGTTALDAARTPQEFELSGEAFGRFQRQMNGFDAKSLYETIPGFHDTPARYRQLEDAAMRDAVGRRSGVEDELAFIRARRGDVSLLADALARGEIPLRVTHNDTKLNNVLLDAVTGEGVCVIDLDTVMPGMAAYDFGDAIRFGACTAAEDERDLDRVNLSLTLYEAFTRGYLAGAGGTLTRREAELLPLGAKLITLEQAMRFLADYLNGDVYYGAKTPDQNLVRTRTQIRLVECMERDWAEMNAVVQRILA